MVNKDIFQQRWKLAFPAEELEVRIMCSDPVALAWSQIEKWLAANVHPPVAMIDMVDCLWYHKYGVGDTRYQIARYKAGTVSTMLSLPDDMPPELNKPIGALFS